MLNRIDHVGIACRDLEASIAHYETVLGLRVVFREVNEEQGVTEAMLHVADGPDGGSYVQLLQPTGPATPVGKFLERRGEGLHHIAYGVPDIATAMAAMNAAGIRVTSERPRHGAMGTLIAFLHPVSMGGVLTELVQPPPAGEPH